MDLFAALRAFIRVAETGSFSAVARETGLSQPAISRQVAALEAHLGAVLIRRTTRQVTLTEDGRDLLDHARSVLEAVELAETSVGRRHAGVTGMVRLSVPIAFGRVLIAPRMHLLLERHPGLAVDLILDDEIGDMVQQGLDVAIRIGPLPADAPFIARRLGAFQRLIVGSVDYLARNQAPAHPDDLARHACILLDRASGPSTWTLNGPEGAIDVPVAGRFHTNSNEAAREAAMSGLGLAVLSAWLVRHELRDGTLREVLHDWRPALMPVHAIYPSQRNPPARTRALIDFLLTDLQSDPQIREVWQK